MRPVDPDQGRFPGPAYRPVMRNFLYRCPVTGLSVQATGTSGDKEESVYVPISCLACGSVHLINPATGQGPSQARPTKSPAKGLAPNLKLECRR